MIVQKMDDFLKHCSNQSMNLLNTNDFNNSYMNVASYFRKIKNSVKIITNSTIIDKLAFIERVVQSFF